MVWFEVFIPGRGGDAINVTLTVEAPNWIGALRTGLKNLGEGHDAIANVMCDVKEDNSIHVTEVATQRVFRLREVPAPAPSSSSQARVSTMDMQRPITIPPPTSPATPAAPAPSQRVAPEVGTTPAIGKTLTQFSVPITGFPTPPRSGPVAPLSPRARTEPESPAVEVQPPAQAPLRAEPAPPPRRTTGQFQTGPQPMGRHESAKQPTDPQIGRAPSSLAPAPKLRVDDAIADVFEATQGLLSARRLSVEQVADLLLDLALAKIPADAGSFYTADVNGHELRFVAVRGPKADAIKRTGLSVPVGQGIIGFCAQEGVCLCVSDIQNDPRYFAAIADAVGYQPKDTLCASAEKDGRLFGAIQLLNSKSGGFDATEMEVLRYLSLTAAEMLERIANA